MGLIKAALGSLGGTLADQWKEYFYCDALDNEVLAVEVKNKFLAVHPIQRGTITLFLTDLEFQ